VGVGEPYRHQVMSEDRSSVSITVHKYHWYAITIQHFAMRGYLVLYEQPEHHRLLCLKDSTFLLEHPSVSLAVDSRIDRN
jgi:hypothetical protein